MKTKDIVKYIKKERYACNGSFNGRVYFNNGKIIFISDCLFSTRDMYEITEEGHIKNEIPIITHSSINLLSWFRKQSLTN